MKRRRQQAGLLFAGDARVGDDGFHGEMVDGFHYLDGGFAVPQSPLPSGHNKGISPVLPRVSRAKRSAIGEVAPESVVSGAKSSTSCYGINRRFNFDVVRNFVPDGILTPCASHPRYCRPRRCGPLSRNSSPATARTIPRSSGASRASCVSSTPALSSCISTTRARPATSCRCTTSRLRAMRVNSGSKCSFLRECLEEIVSRRLSRARRSRLRRASRRRRSGCLRSILRLPHGGVTRAWSWSSPTQPRVHLVAPTGVSYAS